MHRAKKTSEAVASPLLEPPLVMPQALGSPVKADESRERLREFREKIAAARSNGIYCAKCGVPKVRDWADTIAYTGRDAVNDTKMGRGDKAAVLIFCAQAIGEIGEANSGSYSVAESVKVAVDLLLMAVAQSNELKDDEQVLKALRRAKQTVQARRYGEEGGQPQLTEEERLLEAAWYKYAEYCRKCGKPADEEQADRAVSWIDFAIGPLNGRVKSALMERIMRGMEPPE